MAPPSNCFVSLTCHRCISKGETLATARSLHDDHVHMLLPNKRPEVAKGGVQRALSRDIALCRSLWLDEIRIDIVGSVVVTLGSEADPREIVRPDILVPSETLANDDGHYWRYPPVLGTPLNTSSNGKRKVIL
jgi:hypothetical protein